MFIFGRKPSLRGGGKGDSKAAVVSKQGPFPVILRGLPSEIWVCLFALQRKAKDQNESEKIYDTIKMGISTAVGGSPRLSATAGRGAGAGLGKNGRKILSSPSFTLISYGNTTTAHTCTLYRL